MSNWESLFAAQRPRLFGLAYRMLGSAAEAEDVLQEAWLRVSHLEESAVQTPEGLLRKVVIRLCLDQLKSARRTRESYIGPWLPDPVRAEPADSPSPEDRIDEMESLSMAFLLILETLSPLERAAFLLREVFDYGFDEIAMALGRSEAACRQLCHRAREHVMARRSRFQASKAERLRIMQAFIAATSSGDVEQVSQLLCADVVMTSDGGGQVQAARKPVLGRDRVARFLIGISRRGAAGTTIAPDWLNGCPALVISLNKELWGTLLIEDNGTQVTAVRFVLAPGKLRFLRRALSGL